MAEQDIDNINTVASGGTSDDEQRRQQLIYEHKQEKRSVKSRLTRFLNSLAGLASDPATERDNVTELLEQIEDWKKDIIRMMGRLEGAYRENSDMVNAAKVGDEADTLVDHVERETSASRSFLTSSHADRSGQPRASNEGQQVEQAASKAAVEVLDHVERPQQTLKETAELFDQVEKWQTTSAKEGQEPPLGDNLGSEKGGFGAQPETITNLGSGKGSLEATTVVCRFYQLSISRCSPCNSRCYVWRRIC